MAFLSVVVKILMAIFGISSVAAFLNNKAVKDRIERNGYKVDYTNSSFVEMITYFLQDYGYLLIPFYNLKKAVFTNLFKTSTTDYEKERFEKYSQRKVIYPVENGKIKINKVTKNEEDSEDLSITPKGTIKINSVTKNEKPTEGIRILPKEENADKSIPKPKRVSDSFKSLEEEYDYCKNTK